MDVSVNEPQSGWLGVLSIKLCAGAGSIPVEVNFPCLHRLVGWAFVASPLPLAFEF